MMAEKMGGSGRSGSGSGKKEDVEALLDLSLRRFFYSSLAGAFAGLLIFRSPAARWASFAFGAGAGIGSAYTQCYPSTSPSRPLFDGYPPIPTKLPSPPHNKPSESDTPIQNVPDSD